VNNEAWLYRELRNGQGANGHTQGVQCGTGELAALRLQTTAASALLDRVMNWVVGVLLTAGVTALVFIQAHPPR
jgi:hypothetical protein